MPGHSGQLQPALRGTYVVLEPFGPTEQVGTGDRLGDVLETCDRAAVEHAAAGLARSRTDVDDPVRTPYDVKVVLHDEQRVAGGLQPIEHVEQWLRVGRVQSR